MIRSGRVVIGSQAHDSQTMDIDIWPLVRAIERLEEGVAAYRRDPSQTLIRDGLVQRFEFTDDISHRLLRRYLAANTGPPDLINSMNFADIIRLGNEQDLLQSDWRR
jgi:Nucleotidyltransferase substrate binding protein like